MNSFITKAKRIYSFRLSTEGFHSKTQSLNHLVHCNKLYPTRIYLKCSVAFEKNFSPNVKVRTSMHLQLYIVINNAVRTGNIH